MNSSIKNIRTIVAKELSSYFVSPVAYVFIVVFLMLSGVFTLVFSQYFEFNEATLDPFFYWHPWLYMVFVPAVGMRLWSEERRSGTLELLLTLPVTVWQAIWGKYLAGCIFLILCLFMTFPMVITVNYLGDPDQGKILCGFIGSLLVAFTFLAVSGLTSAFTRNQVVSFIISLVVCFGLICCGWQPVTDAMVAFDVPPDAVKFITASSIFTHFESIQRGVINSRDVVYYVSMICFLIFSTNVVLNSRRAN